MNRRKLRLECLEDRHLLTGGLFSGELAPGDAFAEQVEGEDDTVVRIRLQTSDLNGNPIVEVSQGDSFLLQIFVQDVRSQPASADGVFSTYLDLRYDPDHVASLDAVTFAEVYSVARDFDFSTVGLIDEIGASSASLVPLGAAETLLVSIELLATAAGEATFVSEPPEHIGSEILVYNLNDEVDVTSIEFGQTTLNIVGQQPVHLFHVDADTNDNLLEIVSAGPSARIETLGEAMSGAHVTIDDPGRSLWYSPPSGYSGTDQFFVTVRDGDTETTHKVILQVVRGQPGYEAVDDAFTVDRDSHDNRLHVLANDATIAQVVRIVDVSLPSQGGTIEIDQHTKTLKYSPAAGFAGTESFTYTVSDSNGLTESAEVVVAVVPVAPLVGFRFETMSLAGSPITTIEAGEEFLLRVHVGDLRKLGAEGLLAAYLDVIFDSKLAKAAGEAVFGDTFQFAKVFGIDNAGLIDELGATRHSINPPGGAEQHLVDVVLRALAPGELTLIGDPAEHIISGTLLHGRVDPIETGRIAYGSATITVINSDSAALAFDDHFSINGNETNVLDLAGNDDAGVDASTLRVVAPPAHGRVSVSNRGTVTYESAAGFLGNDQFSYRIGGHDGSIDTATVTIQVLNRTRKPVAKIPTSDGAPVGGMDLKLTWHETSGEQQFRTVTTNGAGELDLDGFPAGRYSLLSADTSPFLSDVFFDVRIDYAEDQVVAELDSFPTVGIRPAFIGMSRYLASASKQYVLAEVDAEETLWFSANGGWPGDLHFDLAADYSSLSITADMSDGTRYEANVSSLAERGVHLLGAAGTKRLLRIPGGFDDFDFQLVVSDSEAAPAQATLASREDPANIAEGESASSVNFVVLDAEGESKGLLAIQETVQEAVQEAVQDTPQRTAGQATRVSRQPMLERLTRDMAAEAETASAAAADENAFESNMSELNMSDRIDSSAVLLPAPSTDSLLESLPESSEDAEEVVIQQAVDRIMTDYFAPSAKKLGPLSAADNSAGREESEEQDSREFATDPDEL